MLLSAIQAYLQCPMSSKCIRTHPSISGHSILGDRTWNRPQSPSLYMECLHMLFPVQGPVQMQPEASRCPDWCHGLIPWQACNYRHELTQLSHMLPGACSNPETAGLELTHVSHRLSQSLQGSCNCRA